jgi:hypothetical protein
MDFNAVETALALKHNHNSDPPFPRGRRKRAGNRDPKSENGESGLSDHAQAAAKAYQRRFSRYRFDARIQVSVFREGLTATCWGRTSTLGQDGIGATLSGELRAGEVVSLEFPVPLPPHLMKLRAVVRYSEGLSCGFEFLVMTGEQKLMLHQVCVVLANAS